MQKESLLPPSFSNRIKQVQQEFEKHRRINERIPVRYPPELRALACELVMQHGLSPWRVAQVAGVQLVTMNSWLSKQTPPTIRELRVVPDAKPKELRVVADVVTEQESCNDIQAAHEDRFSQTTSLDNIIVQLQNGSRVELTGEKAACLFDQLMRGIFYND